MKKFMLGLTFFSFFMVLSGYGQKDTIDSPLAAADTLSTDFGLFTHNEVLNLQLRFDIVQYTRKKPKEDFALAPGSLIDAKYVVNGDGYLR